MKINLRFVLLFVLVFCFWSVPVAKADGICYSTSITSVDIVTINSQGYVVQGRYNLRRPALLSAILNLNGRQTWVGYANGGFDPITNVYDTLITVRFMDVAGGQHTNWLWIGYAYGRPTYRQIYWFPSLEQYTDSNGAHMGEHPNCGWNAIEVDKSVTDNLLRLAGIIVH